MARLLSALAAVVLLGGWAFADEKKADDKKADAPSGVWTKKTDEGLTLQLDFTTKDVLVTTVSFEENKITITSKLTAGKDGKWTAKATKIEKKGEFPVELSDKYEFSFKVKVDKGTAKVTEFEANEHGEQGKEVVEGEYKKKEDK